jgi:hypothetical protein
MRSRNHSLANALAQMTTEEVMKLVAESQDIREQSQERSKRKLPQNKIDELSARAKSLQDINQIRIPINVSGHLDMDLEWDGLDSCCPLNFRFVNSDESDKSDGNSFMERLIDSDYFYDLENEKLEQFRDRANKLLEEVEELSDEYDIDFTDLYDKVLGVDPQPSQLAPVRGLKRARRKRARRRRFR